MTQCSATTKTGEPCRMAPTADGLCFAHSPAHAANRKAASGRGGSLATARKKLDRARADAIEKFKIVAPIPNLHDIDACRAFLVKVAQMVLQGSITPAAANSLSTIVRVSKELLATEIDVKLAEKLEELDS
jgi:hypothetical protein